MRLAFALACLLLPAFAQTLSVRVNPHNPVVADEVRLEFELSDPKGVRAEMPDMPGAIDCGHVVDRVMPHVNAVTFVVEPSGPGTCHVPPLTVRYGSTVVSSSPLEFVVASLIAPGETSPEIHDSQEPLTVPEPEFQWWPIISGAVVIVAVVLWFTFGGRKKSVAEPAARKEPAEVLARRRLAHLAAMRPLPREFYSELSRILTKYLDDRLGLGASRCTSVEMLAAVDGTGLLTPSGRDLLEALLEDCDFAKFSPECPVGDSPDDAVACCRRIIDILGAQAASRSRITVGQELTRA